MRVTSKPGAITLRDYWAHARPSARKSVTYLPMSEASMCGMSCSAPIFIDDDSRRAKSHLSGPPDGLAYNMVDGRLVFAADASRLSTRFALEN